MRLLTWNIGSFVTRKYFRFFIKESEKFKYFQPKINALLVSEQIKKIDPDFIFLQEFYYREDAKEIEALKSYEFKSYLDMWYGEGRALIASKIPFTSHTENDINYVSLSNLTVIPIHLHSYSAKRRQQEIDKIKATFENKTNIILLGDFNIWNRKKFFIFKDDIKLTLLLKSCLKELSKDILSTTYLGFALDKIFVSKDITVNSLPISPKVRGKYMDHYPVYFEIRS
jgi:endonuclease/exonuclease/phosphatase family metal-dependent hydrolase